MAQPTTIQVMISSRCTDKILLAGKEVNLSEVRRLVKSQLEQTTFLDAQLLDVWINEDAPPEEGSLNSWDKCLKQVDECDILVVLYNGNAGWAASDANVGICHAELDRALSKAPAKVRLIELVVKTTETAPRHARFQAYVGRLEKFRGAMAETGEEVLDRVKQAVHAAVAFQTHLGVLEAQRGKYYFGEALDWSRLDYAKRKAAIEAIACDSLGSAGPNRTLVRAIGRANVLFQVHAVPDTFSTAEACELVGLPFLRDHELLPDMAARGKNISGPVHLIAVHKNVGESQARKLLGHPDIILVNAPFGFYLADRMQHIQVMLVANCRDETMTRYAVQRCMRWIDQSDEGDNIAEQARKRKKILDVIASQM